MIIKGHHMIIKGHHMIIKGYHMIIKGYHMIIKGHHYHNYDDMLSHDYKGANNYRGYYLLSSLAFSSM